ncbi:MAG: rhodanese-like domain-containing protein [Ornithinibacter sp.]
MTLTTRRVAVTCAAVLAFGVVTAGCSGEPGVSVAAGPTASAAPRAGATLGAQDFAAALKRPGTTVVDVRTPAEFADGHLPGAVNIDISGPDFARQLTGLDPSAPYAVYCRSGNRSAAALAQMASVGFTAGYHLGGGVGAWTAAGGELVTE